VGTELFLEINRRAEARKHDSSPRSGLLESPHISYLRETRNHSSPSLEADSEEQSAGHLQVERRGKEEDFHQG